MRKTISLALVSALVSISPLLASAQQSPNAPENFQNPAPAQFQPQGNPEGQLPATTVEQQTTTTTETQSGQVQAQTESELSPAMKPRAVEPKPVTTTSQNSQSTKPDPKQESIQKNQPKQAAKPAGVEQKQSGQSAVKEQTVKHEHTGKCNCPCDVKTESSKKTETQKSQKTVKSGQSTVRQAPSQSTKSSNQSAGSKVGQDLKHAGQKVEQGAKVTGQKIEQGWHKITKTNNKP